jgi:acyl-CoA thioester hydrolase
MKKKIYYHDTDCGGVVYYANYLKYFEEARTEFLSEKGFGVKELSLQGILFVVRGLKIDYKSPARYSDELTVKTTITKTKNVTLEFTQTIERGGQLLVNAVTQLVCIGEDFKPAGLPQNMIDCLKS